MAPRTFQAFSQNSLSPWTLWLTILLSLGLLAAGILGVALDATEGTNDTLLWLLFTIGGAALLVAGLYAFVRGSAWLGLGLVAAGAIAGSAVLFWSIIVEIAGLIVIVLAAVDARRIAARRTA